MLNLKKAKSSSVTIIGSGLAGYTLVRELRKLDKAIRITVITQDNGDYYAKPQLSTALTHQKTPEKLVLFTAEKFAAQFDIEIIPHNLITHIHHLDYPLVLACGAEPIKLGIKSQHFAINNLNDYINFRKILDNPENASKKIIIIGAGLVGCEFANDLVNTGREVSIVAPELYPLSKLVPEEIGLALKKVFSDKGINWHLGEFFDENKIINNNIIILSAIGLKPNINLAQALKLTLNQGIVVNNYLETSEPNIYALGDCAEVHGQVLPYIQPLSLAARALAKTLLGEPAAVEYPVMPVYIKTSLYPIVAAPPKIRDGKWEMIENNPTGIAAVYYNKNQERAGFCLSGTQTARANEFL